MAHSHNVETRGFFQSGLKHDEFLGSSSVEAETTFERVKSNVLVKDKKYILPTRTYEKQFAQIYFARLKLLQPILRRNIRSVWPGVKIVKILDVQEDEDVAVVGTIYKQQKLKPSILEEYAFNGKGNASSKGIRQALTHAAEANGSADENEDDEYGIYDGSGGALAATVQRISFWADDDSVVLEDESARMALRGPRVPINSLATGVVLAVRGRHEPGGDFIVSDWLNAGFAPQETLESPDPVSRSLSASADDLSPQPSDKYVAFLSGLSIGTAAADMLKLELALDFLAGHSGSPHEQRLASRVARLVILGQGVGRLEALASATPYSRTQSFALQPLKDFDACCAALAADGLPLDLMPGADDPANVALPQQPMHRCVFPGSTSEQLQENAVRLASNPHEFQIEGVHLLCTSGQNVDDVARYSKHKDSLSVMEHMLMWRHIAPTAPDTLACFPFFDTDPFLLRRTPHVFVAGNQPTFQSKVVYGRAGQDIDRDNSSSSGSNGEDVDAEDGGGGGGAVRVVLVSIPSFAYHGLLVLLNLRTLQCHPIKFEGLDDQRRRKKRRQAKIADSLAMAS